MGRQTGFAQAHTDRRGRTVTPGPDPATGENAPPWVLPVEDDDVLVRGALVATHAHQPLPQLRLVAEHVNDLTCT
jgi:hypothetical protein